MSHDISTKHVLLDLDHFTYHFRSERWKYITDSDKEEIGLTQEDDGEFWYEHEG